MSFTGVSFVGDGRPSYSSSTSHGYHLLVVNGYARTRETPNGEFIKSSPFMVGGRRWCIRYYPNGDRSGSADSISLHLCLLDEDVAEVVKVQFGFSFLGEVEKQVSTYVRGSKTSDFSSRCLCLGYPTFMTVDALEKSKHLKDDRFTIRCDVVVLNSLAPSVAMPMPEICQNLKNLLETKVGADVTFQVGGETFAAHRCLLAARSAVFNAQLFDPTKDTTASIIRIEDMEADVFRALLSFIYTDAMSEIEIANMERDAGDYIAWLQQLLIAGDRYDLQKLKLVCEEKLSAYIGVGSVTSIAALAKKHSCNVLKVACLEFLKSRTNFDDILTADVSRVTDILALANEHHCCRVKESCLEFLKSHTKLHKVLTADGLDQIAESCPSVLKELLSKFAS